MTLSPCFKRCSQNPSDQVLPQGCNSSVKYCSAFSLYDIKPRDCPRKTGCRLSFLLRLGSFELPAAEGEALSRGSRRFAPTHPGLARTQAGKSTLGCDCGRPGGCGQFSFTIRLSPEPELRALFHLKCICSFPAASAGPHGPPVGPRRWGF